MEGRAERTLLYIGSRISSQEQWCYVASCFSAFACLTACQFQDISGSQTVLFYLFLQMFPPLRCVFVIQQSSPLSPAQEHFWGRKKHEMLFRGNMNNCFNSFWKSETKSHRLQRSHVQKYKQLGPLTSCGGVRSCTFSGLQT